MTSASDPRTPVVVLTGFLGSGKTTLLSRLLPDPALADSAVIINEFGEVALDHWLVETALEDMVLLEGGCICCSVRGDLVDTLSDLAARRAGGLIPPFSRVVLETTGLADPGPVLQTLIQDPALRGRYRVGAVVATADALHAADQIERHEEARRQVALADRILLTKTDLATPQAVAALRARIAAINPLAPVLAVAHGAAPPSVLLDEADAARDLPADDPDPHEHGRDHHHDHDHGHHHHARGDGLRAFGLVREAPVDWGAFAAWIDSIVSLRGADILRIKGIVRARGYDRPIVIHGVHHVFHEPTLLERWPEGLPPATRLTIVTRGIEAADLEAALEAVDRAA